MIGKNTILDILDYIHTGPYEFKTLVKFVRLQLFTRNRTNYKPKSVHTEPDKLVPIRPGRIYITLCGLHCFIHF